VSTEPSTVTVNVLVVKGLEIDEPAWCTGEHPGANFMADIAHNGTEVSARFETRHGPVDYLTGWITQAPYAELDEQVPVIAVEINNGAVVMDPTRVREFTALTRTHLDVLDLIADECERLRGEGQ
jgi:hypothetical protein